jgi:peroxiredoxin Q/BCP
MTQLKAGDPAPEFELKDAEGNVWRLTEHRGRKVVVFFYPADDTPGCTREACDFRDAHARFQQAGVDVVGVSPQDESSHAAFSAKYSLNFPLLVDDKLEVAKAFGVVEPEADASTELPTRSTFVIDESGHIEQAMYGVRSKGHVESLGEGLQVTSSSA